MNRTSSSPLLARLVVLGVLLAPLLLLTPPAAAHDLPGASAAAPPGKAWIRAGHFVPGMGATAIDLTSLDGGTESMTAAEGVTYGQASGYRRLEPGRYTATVEQVPADGSEPLLSRSFEIEQGDARTIAVVGTAAAPRLVLLADDLTPPEGDAVRVRVLAAASTADGASVTAIGGPVIADSTALGQATDYATVPAGPWTLEVASDDVVAATQTVRLVSGNVYTAVLLDGGSTVRVAVLTDAAGATVTPRGGAATGRGGAATAVPPASPDATPGWAWSAAAALLLAIGGVAIPRRRRALCRRR